MCTDYTITHMASMWYCTARSGSPQDALHLTSVSNCCHLSQTSTRWQQVALCKLYLAISYSNHVFLNPLSPNVVDLQHFDIELFCGFSLRNAFCPSPDIITVSLLVLPFSQDLVIKAG